MNTDVITEKVIGCAYAVSNELGAGFLEKVYENALCLELAKQGLQIEQQSSIVVKYQGQVVGEYFADLIVEGCVIVGLKAVKAFDAIHQAQLLNYLKATGNTYWSIAKFWHHAHIGIKRMVYGTEKQ